METFDVHYSSYHSPYKMDKDYFLKFCYVCVPMCVCVCGGVCVCVHVLVQNIILTMGTKQNQTTANTSIDQPTYLSVYHLPFYFSVYLYI